MTSSFFMYVYIQFYFIEMCPDKIVNAFIMNKKIFIIIRPLKKKILFSTSSK